VHTPPVHGWGHWPPNCKCYWILEYKRPPRAWFLRNFQDLWAVPLVEIWEDSLKEFRTYGGLTSGMDFSRILAPPGGESIRQIRKSVGDARMVRTFSIMTELGLHMLTEAKKFDVFVCFFIFSFRFWVTELMNATSLLRRWNMETILIPLDWGRLVAQLYRCATRWRKLQKLQKHQKLFFRALRATQ